MKPSLLIDPMQPMGRVEVPLAIHFLLLIRRNEWREQRQQVEEAEEYAARDGEGTLAELGPKDPHRRFRWEPLDRTGIIAPNADWAQSLGMRSPVSHN